MSDGDIIKKEYWESLSVDNFYVSANSLIKRNKKQNQSYNQDTKQQYE